jgi:hypothetical protein
MMVSREKGSNRCKSIRFLIIAIVLIAFVPDPGIGSSLDDVGIRLEWSPDNPSKSYDITVKYITEPDSMRQSDEYILSGVPKGSEVKIRFVPASRDKFDVVSPMSDVTMAMDFIPEYSWGVEIKNDAIDPMLVLQWEMVSKAKCNKLRIPKGEFQVKIPDGSDSVLKDKKQPDDLNFGW